MKNISVLGAGGWGTTLAILLSHNKYNVTLWEFNPVYYETLMNLRENFYYLPGVKIPKSIKITNDLSDAILKSELLVVSTPTQFIRSVFEPVKDIDLENKVVVSVSKGIENNSLLLVSDILLDVFKSLDRNNLVALSGPSHAEEVSRKIPTAVVAACESEKVARSIQRVFSNEYFRCYTSNDLIGTEVGGALKNVIAIAAGISDGAGFGDNTKAAIITRGLNEITKMGVKLGAKRETFYGLSGLGDLVVTCGSLHSRNRSVGFQLGQGKKLKTILHEMKMVAEGVATSKSAYQLSKKLKLESPIISEVFNILFKNHNPISSTKKLMLRSLKQE
ncbi:MAG: NAD(P)-dependent glycerol-3-phosphate dehydrogenase [Ignavibacteria bacterium]|nr:NAD(P)-dependent glycerol-3-phosphate dehydrogenase [Ignavibacteria bacterium]